MPVLLGVLVILALRIGSSIEEKPVQSDQLTIIEGSSLITYIEAPLTADSQAKSEQAMSLYAQEKPTFQHHAKFPNIMITNIGKGLYYTLVALLVITVVNFTLVFTVCLLCCCYLFIDVLREEPMANVEPREESIPIVREINCTIQLDFDEDKLTISSHLDLH